MPRAPAERSVMIRLTGDRPLIGSPLAGVTVQAGMHPGVFTCSPDAMLPSVAAAMISHGIHAVVVSAAGDGTPLIVTDLELVRAALKGVDDTRAGDVAREPATTVSTEASLDQAVAMMAVNYVSHLLATDQSGVPAGIISSFDVAAVLGGWQPRYARMLRPAPARPMSSARTLREATIRDVMHPGVATCGPDAPLSVVARIMAEHRVHSVAVAGIDTTGERGQHLTWGLIEDMDLVVAVHRGAPEASAATIAETTPIAIHEGASLDHAAALMVEHDTSHVVVVGPSGLPSGMVSTLEVAGILAASR